MDARALGEALVIAGGAISAIGYLYKKVIRPLARTLVMVEEATPILADIAQEFKGTGSSLKDHLDITTTEIKKAKHDATQTRASLAMYIHVSDKRFTAIEESIKVLTQAVLNLNMPKPRTPRKARTRAGEVPVPEDGASDART